MKVIEDVQKYEMVIASYGLGSDRDQAFLRAMKSKYGAVPSDILFRHAQHERDVFFARVQELRGMIHAVCNEKPSRHPRTACGDFYTTYGLCTMKNSKKHALVHDVMRWDGEKIIEKIVYRCVFRRQPETYEETTQVLDLFPQCPALRYSGRDKKIIKHLKEKGLEDRCDEV